MLTLSLHVDLFLQGTPGVWDGSMSAGFIPQLPPRRCRPLLMLGLATHHRQPFHTMAATEHALTPSSLCPGPALS